MGGAVQSFGIPPDDAIRRGNGFRGALRREELDALDRMTDARKRRSSACDHAKSTGPSEDVFMSTLLDHQGRLETLEGGGKRT